MVTAFPIYLKEVLMQEPRFAIRGETLRTIFGADQAEELVIPEGVTEIESFGHLRGKRIRIYLPDGVTAMKPFSVGWDRDMPPYVALMVRAGAPAEAAARRGGWPCEALDDAPGEALPASPEFEMRGTVLTAYTGQDEDVTIPPGVTDIGPFAFFENGALRRAVLPEGVTRIHTAAFAGCRRLEHISLPKSLGEIGFKAFCCCGLKTVDLPEGLVTLGADALSDDLLSPFSDLRLPNSLRGALRLALHRVRALEVPEGVEQVALTLPKAKALSLPRGVRTLELTMLEAEEIALPEGVERASLTLAKVKALALPRGVRTLELSLPEIEEIALPEGVERLRLSLPKAQAQPASRARTISAVASIK